MQANRSVKRPATGVLLLAATLAAWLGGCTSDVPNQVGAGLVDDALDDVLIELPVQVTDYGSVQVENVDIPVHRQQVLYLGTRNGTSSRILANYDFSDIFTDDHPDTMFTPAKIKSVKLSLTKLTHYAGQRIEISDAGDTTRTERVLYYRVQQLDAPFDSTAYAGYPGVIPSYNGTVLNDDSLESKPDTEPLLRLSETDFLAWLAGEGTVGLVISLGDGSDEDLVGCASRELLRYGELDDVTVGTVVAPNLVVEFEDISVVNFLLPPVADTSTFHEVAAAPAEAADGFILRTGLRSYPAFDFDFSTLPEDVLINRAVLKLTNNRSLSFGNSEAIVVSEIDSLKLAAAPLTMTPTELSAATYVITGQTSLEPTSRVRHLSFDVTTLVQRLANDVYTNPRGLVLTAGEDIFPTYDLTTVDPDFYFTEFHFFGTAAADSLRPRLEITYSRRDERLGGSR